MLRKIETHNGVDIQKVTKPNGELLTYQCVTRPGDSSSVQPFKTLAEARAFLNVRLVVKSQPTKPKSAHPHNQPGYRADNQRKA